MDVKTGNAGPKLHSRVGNIFSRHYRKSISPDFTLSARDLSSKLALSQALSPIISSED